MKRAVAEEIFRIEREVRSTGASAVEIPPRLLHLRFIINFRKEDIRSKQKGKFTVLIEQDEEDYYVATVPAPHGCHTQVKNLDTLMKRVRQVIQLCLEEPL